MYRERLFRNSEMEPENRILMSFFPVPEPEYEDEAAEPESSTRPEDKDNKVEFVPGVPSDSKLQSLEYIVYNPGI